MNVTINKNYSPEPTNHQRTTQRAKSKPWSWWDSYPTPPNTHPIPEWHRRAWRWGHERAGLRQRDSFVGGAILTPASWGLPWIWRRRGWPRRLGLRGMMRRRWLKRASWSVVVLMINWKMTRTGWMTDDTLKALKRSGKRRERESRILLDLFKKRWKVSLEVSIIFAFPHSKFNFNQFRYFDLLPTLYFRIWPGLWCVSNCNEGNKVFPRECSIFNTSMQ